MQIIKLINAKPSQLQGEVNYYINKLQNKYINQVHIQDIKTLMVTNDVEQACIIIEYQEGLTPDMILTV